MAYGALKALRTDGHQQVGDEEHFRPPADYAGLLVYRYGLLPKPGFEYVSQSSTAITGYSPEDYYADPDLDFEQVHPEDRLLLGDSRRFTRGPLVLRRYRKDGALIWTEQHEQPVYDGAGNLVAIEGVAWDVTERELAEGALRQSEGFRAVFGSATLGMAFWSLDGKWLQVNPAMCEITGYTEEELLATDFQSITHPDDLEEDVEGLRRMFTGEVQYLYSEKRYIHKSGREVWVFLSTSLVRDAEDRPHCVFGQIQDISEARKDKENLERMIRQNRSILASAGEGIYGLDLDERTSFVNPAAERMLGYEPGELAGRHQHDIVSHINAEGVPYPEDECPMHASLRDGGVHSSSDEVFTRKDGSTFPVEYVSNPIWEGGEVVGAVVTFRDITERKAAEEALRESEARFRLLAEKMSDLVCLHEPDGRYVYISPSCRRLLGYDPEELLGTDPYLLFHPDDLSRIRAEAHDKALEGQAAVSVIYRIRKKSGEYTWLETVTEPIRNEDGEIVRLQTSSRDVSERKRVERVLADAARAKADFLAEVSHELRTPLTVIRGNAEVGLEFDGDCEHVELLREIVRETSTMSGMVEDLLFLARSESAAPPFRMDPVDANVLMRGLARRATSLAAEHGATLDTTLEETGLVEVDPARVEQAVLALVDNAIKYGPAGQRITLRSCSREGELHIEVGDRGPGIPEAELPRVFERFYRLESGGEPGNGLGLSIAQTVAEAHGGRIDAESRPGEGTRMILILPLLGQLAQGR
ncbi:MAG TPA: PAS domain S-box protein [Rubrobacter sp.]|nr:PAS domain S-box protein [Rubrobacter sp.]